MMSGSGSFRFYTQSYSIADIRKFVHELNELEKKKHI